MSVSADLAGRVATPRKPTIAVTSRMALIANHDAGLKLDPRKLDFFAQRIGKRLRATGIDRFEDYMAFIESPEGRRERVHFVESVTTHTTDFFRENKHYEFMKKRALAELMDAGAGRAWPLRIWSAACSSGSELYSAIITVMEYGESLNTQIRVEGIGTDISNQIIKKASNGIFSKGEINGLSEARRRAWLLQHKDGLPKYRIAPKIRHLCQWGLSNITETSPQGPLESDIIFVRNVLIYFDKVTQDRVVEMLTNRLRPGGFLFTGHSEALANLPVSLETIGSSTYRKIR